MSDVDTRRWAIAVAGGMFSIGAMLASWVTRTPTIRDGVDASTAQMGLILFGLSTGSMIGVLSAARLIRRHGGRRVIRAGVAAIVVGLCVIGVSAAAGAASGVFAGLLLFGLGAGVPEIALNVEAAEIEARTGRRVLPLVHGFFSLGTVAGALGGIGANAAHVSVVVHLVVVAALVSIVTTTTLRGLPAATGRERDVVERRRTRAHRQGANGPDRRLVFVGLVVLAMALAEGSATDWLPLIFVDGYGAPAAVGSLMYTGFAVAMTVGRFAGTAVLMVLSRTAVLRISVTTAAVGVAGIVFADSPTVAAIAVAVWGLGASLGFPLAISAAGDGLGDTTRRVAQVSVAGYIAFLVGPPLLGYVGEHAGLRGAMVVVLVLLLCAWLLVGGTRPPTRAPSRTASSEEEFVRER